MCSLVCEGVYLRDLTFVEVGNPSTLGDGELINFDKLRVIATITLDLLRHQRVGYPFQQNDAAHLYLNNTVVMSEEQLYRCSKRVEGNEKHGGAQSGILSKLLSKNE